MNDKGVCACPGIHTVSLDRLSLGHISDPPISSSGNRSVEHLQASWGGIPIAKREAYTTDTGEKFQIDFPAYVFTKDKAAPSLALFAVCRHPGHRKSHALKVMVSGEVELFEIIELRNVVRFEEAGGDCVEAGVLEAAYRQTSNTRVRVCVKREKGGKRKAGDQGEEGGGKRKRQDTVQESGKRLMDELGKIRRLLVEMEFDSREAEFNDIENMIKEVEDNDSMDL